MRESSVPTREDLPAPVRPPLITGRAPQPSLSVGGSADLHVLTPAPQAQREAPLLWESLVSDGHVRAARLRRVQPWVVGLGVLLLWLGFWIASRAPTVRTDASAASSLQERMVKAHTRANAALAAVPRLSPTASVAGSLPPLSEVAGVIADTLQSLDKSGGLPMATFDFVETDRQAIWKGDWTAERVHYVRDGDVMLVAATVNAGSAARVQPMRWMGAFKKFGNRWQYTSLAGAGFFAPREYPAVQPAQIAQSLAPLLPDER